MSKTGKIAVIGDKDSVWAFQAVGVKVFAASGDLDTENLLRELAREEYAVIFITEEIAETVRDTLEKFKSRVYPTVIAIPSGAGSTGYARMSMEDDIFKAIGTDVTLK